MPLDGHFLAKSERGRFVLVTTDELENDMFLFGCSLVESREEATLYQNTREPAPPGARYELA
ncbi:MAG: hypothetical protein ABI369_16120 [Acetobacteraceae bacterium]